jgi:hypothetical protein
MKLLSNIILSFILCGCTLLTPPTPFDSNLYDHLVTMSIDIDQAGSSCGKPAMQQQIFALNRESKQIVKYTQYVGSDVNRSFILVDKAITEMNNIYQGGIPTLAYCQLNLKIIDADLDLILEAVGGKFK